MTHISIVLCSALSAALKHITEYFANLIHVIIVIIIIIMTIKLKYIRIANNNIQTSVVCSEIMNILLYIY